MSFGLDYVSGPPIVAMKSAGVTFVCRYLSYVNNLTQVKLLTPGEAKSLSQAGISIVSNYEWYANRALEGQASGAMDAHIAASQHATCGGEASRPIYFSVDVDVAGEQVAEYFRGVASVIGHARTGAYGSYRVLKYLFDTGLIAWGWQTYAWSYGAWEPRAHIQQYQNAMSLGGASVDYNRSIKPDFGQWKIGGAQPHMSGVPLGWRDTGSVLYSPNNKQGGSEVPITGPFRDYILANPWPNSNVALEIGHHTSAVEVSNPSEGSGWVQAFRYARLIKPDSGPSAGKVIYSWLGLELLYMYEQATNDATQIGALENKLMAAENQVEPLQAQVTQLQAQVQQLQAELAAAHDPSAVTNRLAAIEAEAQQIVQLATSPIS